MKSHFKKIISVVILILSIILWIFLSYLNNSPSPTESSDNSFNSYTNLLFKSILSGDSLSMHFYVKNPENFGLDNNTQTFGSYSFSDMSQSQSYYVNQIDILKGYNYNKLSQKQKLTYDVLLDYFRRQLDFGDLCICSAPLNSTTGIQAQLPILLCEYKFYCENDIKSYLSLLEKLPTYFNSICNFEKTKISQGYLSNKATITSVIEQCNYFAREDNASLLTESFNSRIKKCKFISSSQKKDYISKNKKAVSTFVIPAYENIISTLNTFIEKKHYTKNSSLGKYPKGKDYYQYLLRSEIGTDKSINDIKAAITNNLINDMRIVLNIFKDQSDLQYEFIKEKKYSANPKKILSNLNELSKNDFSPIENFVFSIKKVDKSLAPYLSPAFYLASPIDSKENTIYINDLSTSSQDIFSLLAHEGIPGHMYQSEFFKRTNPPLIRHLINYGGYSEGWATYVEFFSFSYNNKNKSLSDAFKANADFSLALYSLCDIGVNYEGWSQKNVRAFLKNYGINDNALAKSIYESVSQDPCNYLKYYWGYCEILELKEYMMSVKGTEFSLKNFHDALLTIGPASFPIIKKWLPSYM